jgi:hypothetical protein
MFLRENVPPQCVIYPRYGAVVLCLPSVLVKSRTRRCEVVLQIDGNAVYQTRLLFEHRELVRGAILTILH